MLSHSFPEVEPEIAVVPNAETGLQEVTRVDVSPLIGLVLAPGAEGHLCYYRYPERVRDVVEQVWVSGVRSHRGRNCLETFYRSLLPPILATWGHTLYRVTPEEIRTVYSNGAFFYEGGGGDFDRGQYPKNEVPERRVLRVGDRWRAVSAGVEEEDALVYRYEVTGPYTLTSPAGSWPCLRLVERVTDRAKKRRQRWSSLQELYIADTGRTVLRRAYEDEFAVERIKPWRKLRQGVRIEYRGVTHYASFDCLPDFVCGVKSPDLRWPRYADKWPPRAK